MAPAGYYNLLGDELINGCGEFKGQLSGSRKDVFEHRLEDGRKMAKAKFESIVEGKDLHGGKHLLL